MRDGDLFGRLLETFVVAQLRAQATVSEHRCALYHLRQHHGRHEINVASSRLEVEWGSADWSGAGCAGGLTSEIQLKLDDPVIFD